MRQTNVSRLWSHLWQLPSRKDSLFKQNVPHRCGDGEDQQGRWREGVTKRSFQSGFSLQHGHSHPGLCWLSSLFHHKAQVYLERKLEAFSVHHNARDTGLTRADQSRPEWMTDQTINWACTQSVSGFIHTQGFYSLDCNIMRAWSESTTGNGLKRRYYGYNWKNVNIWWTAVHCAWKTKNHNWANCSQSDFLLRELISQSAVS